jgi:putative transposase
LEPLADRRSSTRTRGLEFTSELFTSLLQEAGIQISMDGRGRWLDNVFVERLWRSLTYEEAYLKAYETVAEARGSIALWFEFYNSRRPHQALDRLTPDEVYAGIRSLPEAA